MKLSRGNSLKIDFESQIWALFESSALFQLTKYNNFPQVCGFLTKSLIFAFCSWKLDNIFTFLLHMCTVFRKFLKPPFQNSHPGIYQLLKIVLNTLDNHQPCVRVDFQNIIYWESYLNPSEAEQLGHRQGLGVEPIDEYGDHGGVGAICRQQRA